MEDYTVAQVQAFLLEKEIPGDVVDSFSRNHICGQAFLNLTEDDLKELAPLIGIRTKIRRFMKEQQKVRSNSYPCLSFFLFLLKKLVW